MNAYREDFRRVESDSYWSLPRIVLLVLVALIVLYGFGFLITGGDLAIYRYWAPKQAAAQREVFRQSQSHVEGTISYLSRLEHEYRTAESPAAKESLRSLIIEESRKVEFGQLPNDLQIFIRSIGGGR